MTLEQRNNDKPGTKRKRRAGVLVVSIIAAIIVVTFVGYNISHVKDMKQPRDAPSVTAGE